MSYKFLLLITYLTSITALPFHSLSFRNVSDPDPTTGNPADTATNPYISQDLINALTLAPTTVKRFTILSAQGPEYLKYDFNPSANPTVITGANKGLGGQGDLATSANFPMLIGQNIAVAVGFMNPCGMNTPHIHTRATEFLTVATGGPVRTGFVLENGLNTQINTTLTQYQGTIFPMGAIHFEFNDSCEPAVFIAGFSSSDPGLSSVAQNFFGLERDIVQADLGFPASLGGAGEGAPVEDDDGMYTRAIPGYQVAGFVGSQGIPASFAEGAESCLVRCGIRGGGGSGGT